MPKTRTIRYEKHQNTINTDTPNNTFSQEKSNKTILKISIAGCGGVGKTTLSS